MIHHRPGRPVALLAPVLALGLACHGTVNEPDGTGGSSRGVSSGELGADAPVTVATDLVVPWEIRFLPDGDLLVTQRPGELVRLSPDGEVRRRDVVPGVRATGESGLMGLALDPDYETNGRIYVCYTTSEGDGLSNRVDRFDFGADGLSGGTPVLTGMDGARIHDGCRLEFGPEGFLFVTMGDAGDGDSAQDTSSLNGKILRITTTGEPAPNNPFGNAVYSYGHRNPQGLATDDAGRLWSTEHGPSGLRSGWDEVNLIVRGSNYGWPEIIGNETATDMRSPIVQSGGDETWAPAGAAWYDGALFFAGLRGRSLYEALIPAEAIAPTAAEPARVEVVAHFSDEYGRLRAVRLGQDGMLYFSTSNRDGRGDPGPEDDRILKVDPAALR